MTNPYEQWQQDAELLGELGRTLAMIDLPEIEVRLPRHLAEAALAVWERDDDQEPLSSRERREQQVVRQSAATLSLVGLSIESVGRWEGDECVVTLSSQFVCDALSAADLF
jgi:hypothetical protein